MKSQIRVIGIDDSPFDKKSNKEVLVVGTIFRGGDFMDGLLSCKVKMDGDDSNEKLAKMINKSKFRKQLKAIFLDGIAVAGFNIIDIKILSEDTKLPVITIIRKKPDIKDIHNTLKRIRMEKKIDLLKKSPNIEKFNNIYIQRANISLEDAKEIINICTTNADIPECIRIAHIIGSGIVLGESRGQA